MGLVWSILIDGYNTHALDPLNDALRVQTAVAQRVSAGIKSLNIGIAGSLLNDIADIVDGSDVITAFTWLKHTIVDGVTIAVAVVVIGLLLWFFS